MANTRVTGRFLCGPGGRLAVVLHEPPPGTACRFAMLYLPPAADEMNKSRRSVAMQARALAMEGGIVALIDLRGTGDSAGEHGDATWEGWRDDAKFAWEWLGTLTSGARLLWGMRLGALLGADMVAHGDLAPASLLLWQPVSSGRSYFTQFLRVAQAQQMTGRSKSVPDTKALRAALATGATIEVAGYDLNAALIAGAERVDLAAIAPPSCPVIWRETSIGDPPGLSASASKLAARWTAAGGDVDIKAVAGPSFWASQEIAEAPMLVASTTAAVKACVATLAGSES